MNIRIRNGKETNDPIPYENKDNHLIFHGKIHHPSSLE
jgi:hypothetical protein